MKAAEKPPPKKLIVCCDGTWQSSVSGKRNIPSNIARLARAIAKAGVVEKIGEDGKPVHGETPTIVPQIVYYDSGVGTGSISYLEQARQGGTGDGLVTNVLEAYNFLVNNYSDGDQVYCFGFSRGAYTARCVAGLINDIGIFRPESMRHFSALWEIYQKNLKKTEFRKTKDYYEYRFGKRHQVPKDKVNDDYLPEPWEVPHRNHTNVELVYENSHHVEVLGCFDTVGSLGFSDTWLFSNAWSRTRFEYLNVKLSPYVKHAFHALALDERREPFLPTLFYIPTQETIDADLKELSKEEDVWPELVKHREQVEAELKAERAAREKDGGQDLWQVWFPGVHINVGGGSDNESYDGEGLSNLAYVWMIQMLGPHLAFEKWTWGYMGYGGYPRRVVYDSAVYKRMAEFHVDEEHLESFSHQIGSAVESVIKKTGIMSVEKLYDVKGKILNTSSWATPDHRLGIDGQKYRWGTSAYQDSWTAMYKAISNKKDRSPGLCKDRSRENGVYIYKLGETNERIHPSVFWRKQTLEKEKGSEYHPPALKGFERVSDHVHGPGWLKEKDQETGRKVFIKEWFIKPTPDGEIGDGDLWQTAEWELTKYVDDKKEVQDFLRKLREEARKAGLD